MTRVALVLSILPAALSAQDGSEQWDFSVSPRFWGLTGGVKYALETPQRDAVETSIVGLLSAAYETPSYFRLADGSLFTIPADGTDESVLGYARLDILWQFGIQQGLFPRSDAARDLAVGFVYYRGQYDLPFEDASTLFSQSGLPETDSSIRGSIVGGVAMSRVLLDQTTRVRQGFEAELALEWGPSFLHNQLLSVADYTRTSLRASGFLPLYVAEPRDERNRFSLYLAGFGIVDWATGPEIPLEIRSTTGGRSMRSAPGGSVRGYGSRRFDSTFKAIGNVELRANLPAIVLPQIVPGLVLFTDIGYYADGAATSPSASENSGLLLSSGAGIYFDLFDLAELVAYTHYLWTEPAVDGSRFVPFGLGFGFHF